MAVPCSLAALEREAEGEVCCGLFHDRGDGADLGGCRRLGVHG